MIRHRYLLIFVGLLMFASLACNAFSGEPLEPGLSIPDAPGSGDSDDSDDVAQLPTAVIQNIAPTATLAGQFPATATPIVAKPVDGDALLRALVDVNIRLGPGVAYARDSFVLKGETAVVLGRHAESGWWKIVCPERSDGNVCWVSGGSQYTSVNNAGAAQSVAAPPTAIPEPTVDAIIAPTAVSDSSASSSMVADGTETEMLADVSVFGSAESGARMVYSNENALWLLPLDPSGAAEPIWLAEAENVGDILISPNGRYVAYTMVDEYDAALHVADIESGVVQTLVDAADLAEMTSSPYATVLIGQMQWLADSEAIAFNTYAGEWTSSFGMGRQEDLWTVDLMGNLIERFPAGEGGGTFVILSNDVVVFGQTTAVVRANLDGTNKETMIEFPHVLTYSEYLYFPQIQWPHNTQDAYTAIASSDSHTEQSASLWHIPLHGQAEPLSSVESIVLQSPIYWSPDGSKIGYVRNLYHEPKVLILAQGDDEQPVEYAVKDVEQFLSWNSAGTYFVYVGENYYAVGQVGEEPLVVFLAEGRTAVSAQWLNDNAFIIALGSAENWDFRQQTTDGPATRLVSGSTSPLFDIWSP